MEQTDFHRMSSRDELAHGSTRWVLAHPGESYIAYTYDYSGPMGLKEVSPDTYDLLWFDSSNGSQMSQKAVKVAAGAAQWPKPPGIGNEVALYVKRAAATNAPVVK